jgi:hypothetical protein
MDAATMKKVDSFVIFAAIVLFARSGWCQSDTEQPSAPSRSAIATRSILSDRFELQYKLKAGQELAYRVEHNATVDTTIQGNRQTSQSRSVSTKSWLVENVHDDGSVRFVHRIKDVDMWSQISGRQPIRYNSRTDRDPPPEYQAVAETIGKGLSVVTMDRHGKILDRTDSIPQIELGVGGLVVPLPPGPVKTGATWSEPSVVRVRLADGQVKAIKTQQRYELKEVKAGVATIAVETQVLTPTNDARIHSQLVQRLTRGQIKFDIDAGRMLSKEMNWDESVVGFNGPKSHMKYVARFTEQLLPEKIATATRL